MHKRKRKEMSYAFTTDKIEVRSLKEGRVPKYVVKGRGMVSGVKDTYQYSKNTDGSYKTFHSMFTDRCLKSIKSQAQHKKLFVDAQHDLALNVNIKSMLKNKLSSEELSKVDKMLKMKELPLAKINDIDISGDSLMVDTELNPAFRELDVEHQAYFDSVWYSLENKFLNGISVNFANPKVVKEEGGDMVIDDVDVLGFSYVDAPASHENSIMEVAIRATQEGEKMPEKENKENTDDVKKQMDTMKSELEGLKADKAKAEADAKQKQEEQTQKSVEEQKEEQKKTIEGLQKKVEELEKKGSEEQKKDQEMNSAKGEVAQKDKYGEQKKPEQTDKVYVDNLKEITKGHDETVKTIKDGKSPSIDKHMDGFAELVNLQAKVNKPTAGMSEEDAKFASEHSLLKKGTGDILVPSQQK